LEGFNSSLAQSAADLWLAKDRPARANHTVRGIFSFLLKLGSLSLFMTPDMLKSPSKR